MIDHAPDERAKLFFRWRAALWAGLAVGALFLFFSKGIPWSSMGFGMAAMGRELPINDVVTYFATNTIVHMALAVSYTFAIGWAVYRFEIVTALVIGAVLGILLYAINYLLFHTVFGAGQQDEFPVAATHFFFGLVSAAAYKAFSVPTAHQERVA